jgi:hypothetical protein
VCWLTGTLSRDFEEFHVLVNLRGEEANVQRTKEKLAAIEDGDEEDEVDHTDEAEPSDESD